MSYDKPYAGLRVVDLSQGVAGPYCAMLLARYGADVVKVEPLEGDWARQLGPRYGNNTAFSVGANAGKRSIALDLKSEAGRGVVERLLPKADVFLEGFRPGVIDRLGFGYARLARLVPRLIYVSISGFGQVGPLAEKPAMDPVLQAFTGFMSENKGPDGVPHRTPTIIVDMSTALYAYQAVATALYARRDLAHGRRIDVSLMEAAANLQTIRMMGSYREGELKIATAPSGTFATSDGWLQMGIVKQPEFETLCRVLNLAGLATDPRYQSLPSRVANAVELNAAVGALLRTEPSDHWRRILTRAGLQNEVLQTYREFVEHPHTEATGLVARLQQPGSDVAWTMPNTPGLPRHQQGAPTSHVPALGEHTHAILTELGYGQGDIDAMARAKAIAVA